MLEELCGLCSWYYAALQEFSTSWDIKATPTFFFLRNGREVDKLVGANKEELRRKVAGVANSQTKLI